MRGRRPFQAAERKVEIQQTMIHGQRHPAASSSGILAWTPPRFTGAPVPAHGPP